MVFVQAARIYTNAGQLDTIARQKQSFGFWSEVSKTTYAYDTVGRVSGIKLTDGMMMTLTTYAYAYAYDVADRMTTKVENGTTTCYSYDVSDQLTVDGAITFSYDATGDRTNTGYATGSGNRTTNDGLWTYTYDAMGDVTKKSKGASSDTWVYAYDNRNQMLTAAYSATDGGTVTQRVTYAYDALGNRYLFSAPGAAWAVGAGGCPHSAASG